MRSASMAISFVWCERRVSESLARSPRSRSCDFERCASPCRCRAPPGWFAICYRPCGSPSPCAGTTTQQLQIRRDLELGLLSSAIQPRVLFPIHRSSDHALCVWTELATATACCYLTHGMERVLAPQVGGPVSYGSAKCYNLTIHGSPGSSTGSSWAAAVYEFTAPP